MSEPFPVNGQRVVLRRLVAADLPAFQQYRSDDELGRYQGWSPMSDADAAEFIARMGAARGLSTRRMVADRNCRAIDRQARR